MTARCATGGMDKRKVCVFLILVAVGILCICVLAYMLFYATGHSNTTFKDGGHSLVLLNASPSPDSVGKLVGSKVLVRS
jgi:hypothetical protein